MPRTTSSRELRLYLRFAYQFRRLNRSLVAALLGSDGARLGALCDAIDRALPQEGKPRFSFTGVDRAGRDLLVCWEIDEEGRGRSPAVFDGELAEHRAELLRDLPRLTRKQAAQILTRRRGCALLP